MKQKAKLKAGCKTGGLMFHLKKGGMLKRADGSYSQRGLWDNIRANKGSGKKPTKEMLKQEKKIKAKLKTGGVIDNSFTDSTPAVGRYTDGNLVKNIDLKIPQYKQSDKSLFQNNMFVAPLPGMQSSFIAGARPSLNINNNLNTGLEFTKVQIPGAKIPMQYGLGASYDVNPNLNINASIKNDGFNVGFRKKFEGGGGIEYADSKFWEDRPTQKQLHAPGYKNGGIHIKKANRGKFTAWAKSHGMGVQQAAGHVMANKEKYSPTIVKRANFARNASKWHKG